MKEVFISYSTIDTQQAETVRNVLEKNGISCWMAPRDIPGGSNYTKEIPIAIRGCKVFVLILSKNAQNSHWVLKELDSAVNCGKVILPFMLEDCILNDEFNFLLTGAQRYAAYQKKAETMEKLIGRVRAIIDMEPKSGEPEVETAVTEEAPAVEEKPAVKKKPAEKTVPVYFGEAVCSACGGSDLKEFPKKVGRRGTSEMATLLLVPLLAIGFGFVLMVVSALFMPWELILWVTLAGAVIGGVLGNRISANIVRNWRVRKHQRVRCFRCNSCNMKFNHVTEIEV